jgi:TolB-like protein
MDSFVSELRRRNVLRVAAAYALVSWILIEAGSVLLPTFGAPEWFFKIYVILVMAGFILSIIIAWVFEITPDGVKLERDIDRSSYRSGQSAGNNYLIIGLLVIALGVSITFNFTGMRGDALDLDETSAYNSIAVLPFTSRSNIEENQFFTDGIHEDILTRLAEIKSLRVISRTSVNEYRDTGRNLREIAENLGVSTIVEGAVQRAGDDVRISVQLVNALTDEQIWASTFDRGQFERAIELDPEYAQAHTSLAETVLVTFANHRSIAPSEAFAIASTHLDKALETDPLLPQAYAVRGLLQTMPWEGTRVGDGNLTAAASFERALELNPNLADGYIWFGSLRRSEGRIEEAIELLTTALTIDPLSRIPYVNLPSLLAMEGHNQRTIELLLHAHRLFPDWAMPANYLSNQMRGLGRLDEAIAWSRRETVLGDDPLSGGNTLGIYQDFGDDEKIDAFIEAFPETHPVYPIGQAYWHWMKRDYETVLATMDNIEDDSSFPLEFTYPMRVGASILTRDFDRAYEFLLKGYPTLNADTETTVDRVNIRFAVLLAYVEQQRNRPREAARLLRQAEIVLRDLPRLGMSGYGIRDVQILTMLGRENDALEALTQAVDEGFVSSQSFDGWPFDADPIIEPLRSDPRFEVLRQRIDAKLEQMRENVENAESTGNWNKLLALAESA